MEEEAEQIMRTRSSAGGFLAVAVMVVAIGLVAANGCEEDPPVAPDAAPEDGGVADADTGLDASPDADARFVDPGTQYDFCDDPIFKLPIDGYSEYSYYPTMKGTSVTYAKWPDAEQRYRNVYLFDLAQCIGYQLTASARASDTDMSNDLVIWTDSRPDPDDPEHCEDLYAFDLVTWSEIRLTETSKCLSLLRVKSDFVAFLRKSSFSMSSYSELVLLNLVSNMTWQLATASARPSYFDVGDQLVVYSAYSYQAGSVGRDIGVWDIAAEHGSWISETAGQYTYAAYTSGKTVTYSASVEYDVAPFTLYVYDTESGDSSAVMENEPAPPFGLIDRHLVVANTKQYNGGYSGMPQDIQIYDYASGVERRLTQQSGELWVAAFDFPYLILGNMLFPGNYSQHDYYVANLVKLGVTDAHGNLLPGEPVIDQPE